MEFNLSEKIKYTTHLITGRNERKTGNKLLVLKKGDIKEFIKRLKRELCGEFIQKGSISGCDRIPQDTIMTQIDKLAGDKLK